MPNRRFLPHAQPLEVRALLTTVLLADIDTGGQQIPSWAGSPYGLPSTPLGNYLLPGLDFRAPGNPVPSVNVDYGGGYGGHGSLMTARYALSMVEAGEPAVVMPLVAGDLSNVSSDAIGRAMIYVANQQAWEDSHGSPTRWVVALPVEPGIPGALELQGRAALAAENVPLSQAAGNDSWPIVGPEGPTTLVMEAAKLDGRLEPSSNHGWGGTPAVIGADPLGTSAAAEVGAAWLATEIEAYPTATAAQLVGAVHAAGTLGQVPQAVPLVITPSPSIHTAHRAPHAVPIPAVVVAPAPWHRPARRPHGRHG
jgi:hypothetical protein